MIAISALLSSAFMALLATSVNGAPSVLETRANERLTLTLYKESGAQRCFNPISDPRFPQGIFRPGKADVNTQCYTETPHNSISIDYVQDPNRKCTVTSYSFPTCFPGTEVAISNTVGCKDAQGANSFYVYCENNDGA